jgi:hypothetical protein
MKTKGGLLKIWRRKGGSKEGRAEKVTEGMNITNVHYMSEWKHHNENYLYN